MVSSCLVSLFVASSLFCLVQPALSSNDGLLVVTVATAETDGFRRFLRSVKKYDLDLKVLGMGEKWDGGDVALYSGGGHKINLLKEGLKEYKDRDDLLVMFVDSYDVVFTDGPAAILEKFLKFDARVVFSAEGFCWPDNTLENKYPHVKTHEKRFLNSGGFIGYAKNVYEIIAYEQINNRDDDQLYYTEIFLNEKLRKKWKIKLDTRSDIFQNLNGALGEVTLKFKGTQSYMYNINAGTRPIVIHGNGPIKSEFNRLANYLADSWTVSSGCLSCSENTISLKGIKEDDFPTVLMAIFVEHPTPFISECFERLVQLKYPKKKIDLFIHNLADYHRKHVESFLDDHKSKYRSVTTIGPYDAVGQAMGKNWAVQECLKKSCNYFMFVDSEVQLTNPNMLQDLIHQNRSLIAPVLVRTGRLWSNFWGAVGKDGYYARSEDYVDIVEHVKIGLWNVPYVSKMYLIQGHRLQTLQDAYTSHPTWDPDMSFCKTVRDQGGFMYVTNQENYGHLIYSDEFEINHYHNDLYEIFNNPSDWEKRYIHENYSHSLQPDTVNLQPCPDVFWFPIVTEKFCQHLIEEMEHHGKWSGGKNEDNRLAGGYENVPTVDIHMNQVGLERHWLHFLKVYVSPLQLKVFDGYFHDPPHAIMNFVVRYKPDEQPLLRPHHDSSTFTINIALNRRGIDFEGGGCRFLRYNCSVESTQQGWMLMHPGRLTHYHEGLRVTKGTRYIMISFVDP